MRETISRVEAIKLGLRRYYTGKPCKRWHFTEREVHKGECIECRREDAGFKGKQVSRKGIMSSEAYSDPKKYSLEYKEKVIGFSDRTLRNQEYIASLPELVRSKIISAKEAKAKKLKRYFTGLLCPAGHLSERAVLSGACLECNKESRRKGYVKRERVASNKPKLMAEDLQKETPQTAKEDKKSRYDLMDEEAKRIRIDKQKQALLLKSGVSGGAILDKIRADNAYMSARKRGFVPLRTDRRRDIILATMHIFQRCRELEEATGEKYEVDHIVPIYMGGLHCAENLQVLSKEDHHKKTLADKIMYAS